MSEWNEKTATAGWDDEPGEMPGAPAAGFQDALSKQTGAAPWWVLTDIRASGIDS